MPGEPTIEQGHIDAALTDFAVQQMFFSTNYVANIIAPPQAVPNRSGDYFVIDPREGMTDDHEEELMYGQPSPELNFVVGKGSYACQLVGKKHLAPDGILANADPAIQDTLKGDSYLLNNMRIRRERALWRLITEDASYPGGAGGTHWFSAGTAWDQPTADPKVDIDQAVRAVEIDSGVVPNTLLCPPRTYDVLTRNDEIKDLIRYQRGDLYLRTGGIGDVVFNLRLIRAGALYDAAAPLETAAIGFIWEDDASDAGEDWAWVGYVDPRPGLFSAGFATQFIWNMNRVSEGLMGRLRVWRDEDREGEWHDFRTDYQMKVTNNRAGAVITDIETPGS